MNRPVIRTTLRFLPALGLAGLMLAAGIFLLVRSPDEASTEPGTSPQVTASFIGSQSCVECHSDKAEAHAQSGHASTFALTKDSDVAKSLNGKSFHDPEWNVTFRYRTDAEGLLVTVPEVLGDDAFPLQYALGSGQHAVTFLTLIPSLRDGTIGIEHRVSWYPARQEWALTPSHAGVVPQQDVEHFGKIIRGEVLDGCISCHTTNHRIEGDQLVDLEMNVGCESCHGPGSRHVAEMQRGSDRRGFAEDLRSWSAQQEIRMCGRCHRNPEKVPPDKLRRTYFGLPRFQSVGLVQSECFTKSGERLRCTTCHDPHQRAAAKSAQAYEQDCLACHQAPHAASPQSSSDSVVACPVSPTANCLQCHMPKIQVHPGVLFRDHWIRVRDGDDPAPAEELTSIHDTDAAADAE